MIVGVNLSFFYFFGMLYMLRTSFLREFRRMNSWRKIIAVFFAIGALSSVLSTLIRGDFIAFRNAMVVIPNYLYWTIIIFLIHVVANKGLITLHQIYKGVAIGLIASMIYYVLLQNFFANDLFFKAFEPNNFSFLLISLTPQTLYSLKKRYNVSVAYLVLALVLALQLYEGRRAGFGLILISGLGTLNSSLFQFQNVSRSIRLIFYLVAVFVIYNLSFVENIIKDSSPRIHQLAYEGYDALDTDRSYLTRLAMIDKGLVLFSQHPISGVGLNNFTAKEANISGDFEGSQFVINKDIFKRTSSHNSYINILAEGGLMLFIPFILLLISIFYGFIKRFRRLTEEEMVMLFSMTVMSIHLYFMNAYVNSLAWFNISLAIYALINCNTRLRIKRVLKVRVSAESTEINTVSGALKDNHIK